MSEYPPREPKHSLCTTIASTVLARAFLFLFLHFMVDKKRGYDIISPMWVVKVETNISGNDVVTFDTCVSVVYAFLLFLDAVYPEEAVVVHAHYLVLFSVAVYPDSEVVVGERGFPLSQGGNDLSICCFSDGVRGSL
jgi:hypothetical protein